MSIDYANLPVVRVPKDSTSTALVATFKEDGVALDLSSASGSKYFHAKTRDSAEVTSDGAASWVTDGSDGQVTFALTATEVGTVRDIYCEFEVQGYSGGNLVSYPFILRVSARAKAA